MIKLLDQKDVKFAHFKIDEMIGNNITPSKWGLQALVPILKKNSVERHIHGQKQHLQNKQDNSEAWVCFSGKCDFEIYSIKKILVYSAILNPSEVIIVERGGNAITRATDDFKFLELKLGPYTKKNWEYF